jgi:hypothetical protein
MLQIRVLHSSDNRTIIAADDLAIQIRHIRNCVAFRQFQIEIAYVRNCGVAGAACQQQRKQQKNDTLFHAIAPF